jgi:hypothetical protein
MKRIERLFNCVFIFLILSLSQGCDIKVEGVNDTKSNNGGNNDGGFNRIIKKLDSNQTASKKQKENFIAICDAFKAKTQIFRSPSIDRFFYVDYSYSDCGREEEKYTRKYNLNYKNPTLKILKFVDVNAAGGNQILDFEAHNDGLMAEMCSVLNTNPDEVKVVKPLDAAMSRVQVWSVDTRSSKYCTPKEKGHFCLNVAKYLKNELNEYVAFDQETLLINTRAGIQKGFVLARTQRNWGACLDEEESQTLTYSLDLERSFPSF